MSLIVDRAKTETRGPKHRKITQDMLLAAATMARARSETPDQYLERVTHFHLQAKRIKKIEGLEKCSSIKVRKNLIYVLF